MFVHLCFQTLWLSESLNAMTHRETPHPLVEKKAERLGLSLFRLLSNTMDWVA